MILRRPYAFLIKHFRLIHMILFILFGYITYKANNILSFFKEYISNNGNMIIDSSEYISSFIFLCVILIIVVSVVIYFLMRYKKKPKLFYIILIIVSVISIVLFIYLYNNIKVLEISVVSGRQIRLLRDLSRLNFWMLFLVCIPVIIRGLGFDIKKFNFSSDLQELKLEEKDSEEVEVNVELNSDTVMRTGRRIGRELKYYYLDNKLIIDIILGICIFIFILMVPFNKFVINRDLKEGEVLGTNYFNISINESYVSNRNRVSKNNSYVILKISVIGKSDKYKLDMDDLLLFNEENKYIPSMKYYLYFSDIGKGYKNNVLSTDKYEEYILVYNIKNEDRDSDFYFRYVENNRKIKLSLEEID